MVDRAWSNGAVALVLADPGSWILLWVLEAGGLDSGSRILDPGRHAGCPNPQGKDWTSLRGPVLPLRALGRSRPWILDLGSWVLETWILDPGSWILLWALATGNLDSGSWILDPGRHAGCQNPQGKNWTSLRGPVLPLRVLGRSRPWILDRGSWILDPVVGPGVGGPGFWILDLGSWQARRVPKPAGEELDLSARSSSSLAGSGKV